MKNYLKRNRQQLARYFLVTLFIFLFSLILFYIFYSALGISYQLAVSFVYVATVACHFSLHRSYTFGASMQNFYLNFAQYSALLLINYLLTLLVSWLVLYFHLSPYLTFCISPLVTAFSSFLFLKYLVFKFKEKF